MAELPPELIGIAGEINIMGQQMRDLEERLDCLVEILLNGKDEPKSINNPET